jgi:photosystem II stability/assembly factor-like uncharacterized protein
MVISSILGAITSACLKAKPVEIKKVPLEEPAPIVRIEKKVESPLLQIAHEEEAPKRGDGRREN